MNCEDYFSDGEPDQLSPFSEGLMKHKKIIMYLSVMKQDFNLVSSLKIKNQLKLIQFDMSSDILYSFCTINHKVFQRQTHSQMTCNSCDYSINYRILRLNDLIFMRQTKRYVFPSLFNNVVRLSGDTNACQ